MAKSDTYDYSYTNIQGYEVCYFRNICNRLIPYPVNEDLDYMPIDNGEYYIPKEDIIIYTAIKGEDCLCPLAYTVNNITNKINPINMDKYKHYKMFYGSRNQFLYQRIPLNRQTQTLSLPYVFRSGYNVSNYFVFVNGRLLNSIFYKILIPSLGDNLIEKKTIYFSNVLNADDTVDIFYIGNNGFNNMSTSGNLVVKPLKVRATEPIQRKFLIPLPYKYYPINDYNSFLVFKHSTRISTEKYKITSDDSSGTTVYYLELLDVDEYLIYGDELVFIFPYYKANWETTDALTKTNMLNFITTYYTTTEETDTITFPTTEYGDITDTSAIYVFKETKLLSLEDYTMIDKTTIKLSSKVPINTEFAMVLETDTNSTHTNNLFVNYVNLPVVSDGQWSLQLPFSDTPKTFVFFRKGKMIPQSHYSVIDNKFILGRNYNDLEAGEIITAIYTIDGSNSFINCNFQSYELVASLDDQINLPNEIGIQYNKKNMIVFVNDTFIANAHYVIAGNTIKFNENILLKKDNVTVWLIYKTINTLRPSYRISDREYIRFFEEEITAGTDARSTYEIPYPDMKITGFTDIPFIIFIRGLFISEDRYSITTDENTKVKSVSFSTDISSIIKKDDQVDFIFCYTPGYSMIQKTEYKTTIKYPTDTIQLPYVYTQPIELYERMMVFYGETYVDSSRYTIDPNSRILTFKDIPYDDDTSHNISCVFFYTGSSLAGSVGYVPESGYLFFNEEQIDRNLNKELLMVFVNGLLVPKSEIFDISNSVKKITRDIKTRYDLNIINCSPLITEFKRYFDSDNSGVFYGITIIPSDHQKIKVTIDLDKEYYSSFSAKDNSIMYVQIIPDRGYNAGDVYVDGVKTDYYVTINDDHVVTAGPAIKAEMKTVTITQSKNQIISVLCNNQTYTSSFTEKINSPYTVSINSSRDGFIPGTLSTTSGTLTKDITISATASTTKMFTLNILDSNLENQKVTAIVTDPSDGSETVYSAPCNKTVPYGNKIRFHSISSDGYNAVEKIGPFLMDKNYYISYRYPLDNLVVEAPTAIVTHTLTLYPSVNEILYVYIWSKHTNKNITSSTDLESALRIKHEATEESSIVSITVNEGDFYEFGAESKYGYTAGEINSSTGLLSGVVETNIKAYITEAEKELPIMFVTRDSKTSSYYEIEVKLMDGYQSVGEGVYAVRVGTSYQVRSILHNKVIQTKYGVMSNEPVTLSVQPDGSITVKEGE